nr:unnamed protein product [Callosobruchus chinensis]
MCKHIHLLCRTKIVSSTGTTVDTKDACLKEHNYAKNLNDIDEENLIINHVSRTNTLTNEDKLLEDERFNILAVVKKMMTGADSHVLQYIKAQVSATAKTVKVLKEKPTVALENSSKENQGRLNKEPANKNIEHQKRLYSTKNKLKKKKNEETAANEKQNVSLNL